MEENEITQHQMLEAMDYVRGYVKLNGGNPYDIDWDNKPRTLPNDVSRAWDTYVGYWDMIKEKGIIV